MGGNSKGRRRRFGTVRKLPAGRYQARYRAEGPSISTIMITVARASRSASGELAGARM
jgi:hypothetical protein